MQFNRLNIQVGLGLFYCLLFWLPLIWHMLFS